MGCPEWAAWRTKNDAVRSGDWHSIELRAAARTGAAFTLTGVKPIVERVTTLEQSSEFACLVAGGGNPAFTATLNLDDADSPLSVGENDGAVTFEIPPDSFEVGEGLIEKVNLFPSGGDGRVYEFRLEVEYVVDGETQTVLLDDGGAPFVFGFAEAAVCWQAPTEAAWTQCP